MRLAFRLGCPAQGMARETWRPTFHLSTAGNEMLVPTGWLGAKTEWSCSPGDMTRQDRASGIHRGSRMSLGDRIARRRKVLRLYLQAAYWTRGKALFSNVLDTFLNGNSGVYFVAHRSAGFSNPHRQPKANVAFVVCHSFDRGALPRWLSEFRAILDGRARPQGR